jgi:hypothetical protein
MTAATNYTVNKFLVDTLFRGQNATAPTSLYYGLFVASKGYWTATTAYSVGDTIIPIGFTPAKVYKCTVAGTSGGSAPTWSTASGATVVDNTVTWVEQTPSMLAGTFTEASYTGYGRIAVTSNLTNWAATQGGSGTSSGTSGTTSNSAVVTFGAPTSQQSGVVVGMFLADASTAGNILFWSLLTNPKTINNGDASPNFPIGAFTMTWN